MKLYGGNNKSIWIRLIGTSNEVGPYQLKSVEIIEDGTPYSGRFLQVETQDKGTLYFVMRNIVCWRIF